MYIYTHIDTSTYNIYNMYKYICLYVFWAITVHVDLVIQCDADVPLEYLES